ncbi:FecR domain-containing protein [Duganella zoogloeoides]|uniref:FecR domain-containing protein n=1 Tax=Duganella zoogloeoides TaxID=75659 RepID=A0ABZ0Y5R1_9BURK|nr:FecR family protein [Duganella zoogloeoides]WQH06934.1 FecR domain-containing protein [Duganella zoogloeoides]
MSNIDHQALEWLARQARGPLAAAEQAALDAWLAANPRHQGAWLRAHALDHTLRQALLPEAVRPAAFAFDGAHAIDGGEADGFGAADSDPAHTANEAKFADASGAGGDSGATTRWPTTSLAPGPAPVPATSTDPRPRSNARVAALAGMAILAMAVGIAFRMAASDGLPKPPLQAAAPTPTPVLVLETALGELRKVPLADRSLASIDSATRLEVSIDARQRRIGLLKGQAWFQVAKDAQRPFVVSAGAVSVTAVGTAFAVQRQPGGADVVVTEGVVEVRRGADHAPVRIAAGQQAYVAEQGGAIAVRRQADAATRQLAWREGMIVLQNDTLARAVAQFNRYNRRQLIIADPTLRSKTLVGRYRVYEAEQFANDVQTLLKVPVRVSAEQIRIGGR